METHDSLKRPDAEHKNKVDHPQHYNKHPSGVECIDIVEHLCFNLGNAIKYIWRADLKGNATEDLEKAIWYIQRELLKRSKPVYQDPIPF